MATSSDDLAEKLWHACVDGHMSRVLDLLKQGADPNDDWYKRVKNGWGPLYQAASRNHHHIAQYLIQWGSRMDAKGNEWNWTPLHDACYNNSLECAEVLLKNHCLTGIKNKEGRTAVDMARRKGHITLSEYVANYKAPPKDPLCSFPSFKHFKSLQVTKWQELGRRLGVSKAEIERLKNDHHPTAYTLLAAKVKNPKMRWKEIVEGFLSIGEYKLAKDTCTKKAVGGHSPLSVAAYYGWLDLLKFLLETEGLDPKGEIDKAGDSVLSVACARGNVGVIDYLLKLKGFDINDPVNAAGDTLHSLANSLALSEVIKYLDNYDTDSAGGDEQKTKHVYAQKLDKLIREKKTINVQYLKVYFIGPAGIGKTTTRKRLTGAIVNLSKLSPEERKRCSTYLAECTQVLAVVDESDSKLILQASDNLDEEAQLLFHYLYGSKSNEPESTDTTPSEVENGSTPTDQQEQAPQHGKQDLDEPTRLEKESPQEVEHVSEGNKQVKPKPASTHVKVDVDQMIARLHSIVGSGKYTEQLLGKILLNLVDVGGQPGFLEMLPFLSKGPGIFLGFFPLHKDLDEHCEVSYERGDEKITPYKTTYTIRETLSQILASISHHVSLDSTADDELANKLGSLGDVQPVATLVGTYKDKLETQVKSEILHEKLSKDFPNVTLSELENAVQGTLGDDDEGANQHSEGTPGLLSAIEQQCSSDSFKEEVKDRLEKALTEKNEALGSVAFNFQELLSFPTDDRCFIPVDNYTGTDVDIDPLRKHLQDVFGSHFKDAKIPMQPSQLLLGVILRKEYDIVSMEDCVQIGRALNMGEEDVRFTVWYLDHCVGALIYHPDIEDDWFKQNIICSPQVVFDSTSALIIESLLEVHSQQGTSKFKLTERKDWVEKGQFSLDTVKRCHSEQSKKKVQERKLIPVDKLVKLLEHSNLLAKITTKEVVGRRERLRTMCFIPAILDCATPEELTKSPPPDADTPSPVKITFEPRYVPVGVFCAMISRFVSSGRDGILGMKWELADSSVKRNLITFRVDAAEHLVTLVAQVECIEVRLIRQDRSIRVHDLASYVLSTVIYMIKQINHLIQPIVAFDCQCGRRSCGKLCLLSAGVIPCFKCKHKNVSLTAQQERWFSKDIILGDYVSLVALPFAGADQSISFKWSKQRPLNSKENELVVEKVTRDHCTGYYTCEIFRNGEPFFNVYHCLKVKGESKVSKNDQLLDKVREEIREVRSDWYSLAVELDINYGTRKAIDYHRTAEVCFHVMLQHWVSTSSPAPTYAALARALKSPPIGREDLASDVQDKGNDHHECDSVTLQEALSGTSTVGVLEVDKHLKVVRSATWDVRAKWKDLAVELDISEGDREQIEYNHPKKAGSCFTAMLENWITRKSPPPTWAALIEAIRSPSVGRADIADELECHLIKE